MRRWLVAFFALAILLAVAWYTRYDYRSAAPGYVHKIDRWTGRVWLLDPYSTDELGTESAEVLDELETQLRAERGEHESALAKALREQKERSQR